MLVGCSAGFYGKGRKLTEQGQYDEAIKAFYEEIARYPQRSEAWRELGVAFYEKGDLGKAEDALKQANSIKPDARTNLYLGLIYEKQEMIDPAIAAYGVALGLGSRGKTGNMIRAHLDRLVAKQMKAEVDQALQAEESIDVSQIPDNTVAVVSFDGSHLSPEMAPIARGLAEFTSIDLAKVGALRVIDRLKIDMILEELKLGASSAVAPATAPRMGKLLGSRQIVGGAVMDLGGSGLRLDGVIVNTDDSSSAMTNPAEGDLDEIFRIQKEFVFTVIEDLGITLTKEERDAISEVPTESYLAFLAYSRGLDFQQRGFYRDAQASFQQAVQQDQGFGEAASEAVSIDAALSLGPDYSLAQFESAVVAVSEPATEALSGLDSHLRRLSGYAGGLPEFGDWRPANAPPGLGQTAIVRVRVNLNVDMD
jgi:tetratricopeptide (TPR) repeat protein